MISWTPSAERHTASFHWPAARLSGLSTLARESPHWFERTAASVILSASEGDYAAAQDSLETAVERAASTLHSNNHQFEVLAIAAFIARCSGALDSLLCKNCGVNFNVSIDFGGEDAPLGMVGWTIAGASACSFQFSSKILTTDSYGVVACWVRFLKQVVSYMSTSPISGSVCLNLWDKALGPGVAFSSNRSDTQLCPDTQFIIQKAYKQEQRYFDENEVPWDLRQAVAYWRGSTTGIAPDWRSLQRVRLATMCNGPTLKPLTNVGISQIVQIGDPMAHDELERAGALKPRESWRELGCYKYLIDIDGNTNAWPGYFLRLLSGGAILKVESEGGFRQWYYDRLQPWIHFVPVSAGLEDLAEKLTWLERHDQDAQEIGRRGRAVAAAMDLETELTLAHSAIYRAFLHNATLLHSSFSDLAFSPDEGV